MHYLNQDYICHQGVDLKHTHRELVFRKSHLGVFKLKLLTVITHERMSVGASYSPPSESI